jgi:Fic family protein
MKDLLKEYEQYNKNAISSYASFHKKFEEIHPFSDGNGRVGRIILYREMLKNNLMPAIIPAKHRREYLKSFLLNETNIISTDKLDTVIKKGQEFYQNKIMYFYPDNNIGLKYVDYKFPGNISIQKKWEESIEDIS